MNRITYNGVDLASLGEYPLVEASTEYLQAAERWDQVHSITLSGKLIDCTKSGLDSKFTDLLTMFSSNFKILSVEGVGDFGPCKIISISSPDSNFIGYRDYSVTLQKYKDKSIIDPSHDISYSEGKDGILTISQSISAKGVNTSNSEPGNALDNAKAFVEAQMALAIPNPFSISLASSAMQKFLMSQEYSTDTLNGTVSLSRTYTVDLVSASSGAILRYIRDTSSALGQKTKISYDGEIYMGHIPANGTVGSIQVLRDRYLSFRAGVPSQNVKGENVTEDPFAGRLNFSFYYETGEGGIADNSPEFIDDFSITVSESADGSLVGVQISGSVSPKVKCGGDKFDLVEAQYNKIANFHFDLCLVKYRAFYTLKHGGCQELPDGVLLWSDPLNTSVSKDVKGETISYSASFDDRFTNGGTADKVEYTASISPPVQKIQVSRNCAGGIVIVDSGTNTRGNISVSVSANCNDSTDTMGFAEGKASQHLVGNTNIVTTEKKTENNTQNDKTSVIVKEYDGPAV